MILVFKVLATKAVIHVRSWTLHYIVQELSSNICKSVERAFHNITTYNTVECNVNHIEHILYRVSQKNPKTIEITYC